MKTIRHFVFIANELQFVVRPKESYAMIGSYV
jgi:hypothetical protein